MRVSRTVLLSLLLKVIRPAVIFAMRHSIRLQDYIECVKLVYVEVARRQLAGKESKPNVSKISIMTGVHRRDVIRLLEDGADLSNDRDLVTKVIGHWQTDKRFITKSGKPKVLSIKGAESEFARLVSSVSQDLNPGTVFFELSRIEAVSTSKDGVKLLVSSFVPQGDPGEGFAIYAKDGEDLARCVEENVLGNAETPQFHARTEFDAIRSDVVDEMKRWFLREGHEFHARVRAYLSKHDQDVNPDPKYRGTRTRVVFSSFSLSEESKKK